jgi:hypothetical protein
VSGWLSRVRFLSVVCDVREMLDNDGVLPISRRFGPPKEIMTLYSRIFEGIESDSTTRKERAWKILSWMKLAEWEFPWDWDEMSEALAVDDDIVELKKDQRVDEWDIVESCRGLIIFDERSRKLSFAHRTITDAFRSIKALWHSWAGLPPVQLGKICLTYLNLKVFEAGPCNDRESFDARLRSLKFGRRAAQYWPKYVRGEGESSIEMARAVFAVVGSPKKREAMLQLAAPPQFSMNLSSFRQLTVLHVFAMNGLSRLCEMVLNEDGNRLCRRTLTI